MAEGIRIGGGGKKSGAYVWKKLTAQGGDFVEFAVDNDPNKYPDGGEQGGYWYEKFQLDPTLFGCTKYAVDTFTFTSATIATTSIKHSLGVIPLFAIIVAKNPVTVSSRIKYVTMLGGKNSKTIADFSITSSEGYSARNQGTFSKTDINVNYSGFYYAAGVEYTLITMA